MTQQTEADVTTAFPQVTDNPSSFTPIETEYADEMPINPECSFERVTMSPAVEKNFGHFDAKERLKQADYLRVIARQLEVSAKIMKADEAWKMTPEFIPAERWELPLN